MVTTKARLAGEPAPAESFRVSSAEKIVRKKNAHHESRQGAQDESDHAPTLRPNAVQVRSPACETTRNRPDSDTDSSKSCGGILQPHLTGAAEGRGLRELVSIRRNVDL